MLFIWSHFFIDLDLCFRLLSCWKVKRIFIYGFLKEACGFCAKTDLKLSIIFLYLNYGPSPSSAEVALPLSWLLSFSNKIIYILCQLFCRSCLFETKMSCKSYRNKWSFFFEVNQNHYINDRCMIITLEHGFECDW